MHSQQETILQAVEKFVFKVFEHRSSFPDVLRLFESTKRTLTDFELNSIKTLRSKSALTIGIDPPNSAKQEIKMELKLSPTHKQLPQQDRIIKLGLKEYLDRKRINLNQDRTVIERYSHIRELVPDSQNLYRVLGLGFVESLLHRSCRDRMQGILDDIANGKIDLNCINDNKSKNMRTIFCSYLSQLSKAATKDSEIPKAKEELYDMCNKHQIFDQLMVAFSKGVLLQELSKSLGQNSDLIFKVQRGIGVRIEELLPFLPDAFDLNFQVFTVELGKIQDSLYTSRKQHENPTLYVICEQYALHQNYHILCTETQLPRMEPVSGRGSYGLDVPRTSLREVSIDTSKKNENRSPSQKRAQENAQLAEILANLKFYPVGDSESAKKKALSVRTSNQENSYKKPRVIDIDLEKDQPFTINSDRKIFEKSLPSPPRNYPVTREDNSVTRMNLATPTQKSASKPNISIQKSTGKAPVLDLSAEYNANNTSKISTNGQNIYRESRENHRETSMRENSKQQTTTGDYMLKPSDSASKKKALPKMMTMKPINMETLPSNPFSAFTPSIYSAKEYLANANPTKNVFPPYPNYEPEPYPRMSSVEPVDRVYNTMHYGAASMSNGFKRYSQAQVPPKLNLPTMAIESKSVRRI